MGLTSWIIAGLLAFVLSRFIPTRRSPLWAEALVALAFSVIAGGTASALDFGGWKVFDLRSGLFALLVSFAAIGALRMMRKTRAKDQTGAAGP